MQEKDQKIENLQKEKDDKIKQLHRVEARVVELESTDKARHDLSKELKKTNRKLAKSEESVGVTTEERDRVTSEHGQLVTHRDGLKS